MGTPIVRRARPAEAPELSDMMLRSKGYWGYDAAFLDACRDELTLTPEAVASVPVYVAEIDGHIAGICRVESVPPGDTAELVSLFIEPAHVGHGLGRLLLEHAKERARALGCTSIIIQSDPHAASFYRAHGAVAVGARPSGSIPGRDLPLLRLSLDL